MLDSLGVTVGCVVPHPHVSTINLLQSRQISFYSTLQIMHFFFYKLKVCGKPVCSKSVGAIFPAAPTDIMSVSHFGSSCNISNFS